MCMGGGGTSQTVIQQDKLPQWVQDQAQGNIATANSLAARSYQPYGGPRVASFTPSQTKSFDLARDLPGAGKANFDAAAGVTKSIAEGAGFGQTYNPTSWINANIGAYMNPYLANVTDPKLREINRQAMADAKRIGAGAMMAGAYGDARHGIREQGQMWDTARLRADVIGQDLAAAYGEAGQRFQQDEAARAQAFNLNAGQFNADRTARAQAAQQLGALTKEQMDQAQRDIFFLNQMGQMEQAQVQQNYDTAYQDFQNQQQYPVEMLNLRMAALTGTPYATTRMNTQPPPNTMAQNMGAAGALAGGLGMLFGSNAPTYNVSR